MTFYLYHLVHHAKIKYTTIIQVEKKKNQFTNTSLEMIIVAPLTIYTHLFVFFYLFSHKFLFILNFYVMLEDERYIHLYFKWISDVI